MAMSIAESVIIAAGTAIAPNGSEAVPVAAGTGATIGPFADYANSFAFRVTNGSSAPTVALTIAFYGVAGARLYEVGRYTHDTSNSSAFTGAIPCPPGFAYFTARAFGNATNPVTVEVFLERQVP